ncbi:MAG: hypothetical protein V7K89_00370 [Nostoc sp.]|uniref:hypothetical protein n=1 Tax=Nostoc sp. TaxID=1180 RepID=UPI002FF5C316
MSVIKISDLQRDKNQIEPLSISQINAVIGGGENSYNIGRYIGILLGIAAELI